MRTRCLNPSFTGIPARGCALWTDYGFDCNVLILLLLEYPLLETTIERLASCGPVLILLLMEYPLWQTRENRCSDTLRVLILLLLEYPLGPSCSWTFSILPVGLNPSFNGIPALGRIESFTNQNCILWNQLLRSTSCLNPSFTGIPARGSWDYDLLGRAIECLNPSFTGIPARGQDVERWNSWIKS